MKYTSVIKLFSLAVFFIFIGCKFASVEESSFKSEDTSESVHAFYYPWFGNIETDGGYYHWNHRIEGREYLGHSHPGGDDIGANFYPKLGCYSSNSERVIDIHMQQLKQAGIEVISVSWWGQGSFEDKTIPRLLNIAYQYGIKVNFHIEPFGGRNAKTMRKAIKYIIDSYGSHPAFYRDAQHGNRPMFYIFLSNSTSAEEWATILDVNGSNTIRGTKYDSIIIGHWVGKREEASLMLNGHFDGFYTYFVVDGITFGSTTANWGRLASWARDHDKIFIPCVGPGYDDTRIRPRNAEFVRSRNRGAYYDHMFKSAIRVNPPFIGLTSFNEWHEGTQIEPAVPKSVNGYVYKDYEPLEPDYYLNRTRYWVQQYMRKR